SGFGLVVRKEPTHPHTSIMGGSFYDTDAPENNNPNLYWNGDTAGGAAFDPGTAFHTYRLEVRGTQYTLLIDGQQMVQYSIADFAGPVKAGIFAMFYKTNVTTFAVYPLDASN